jgi:DNA-binding NtrC family response regulator
MGVDMQSRGNGKAIAVLIHDDVAVCDVLRGMLDANGFHVEILATLDAARARMSAGRIDVALVVYDRPLGGEFGRWAATQALAIRSRFVYLVDVIPPDLLWASKRKRIACIDDLPAVLSVTISMAEKPTTRRPAATDTQTPQARVPRLLLAEDDPAQLREFTALLSAEGFAVVRASSGRVASSLLESDGFDVVLSDWEMSDGSGSELYDWVLTHKPALAEKLVFMTGGDTNPAAARVGPTRVIPKGQDSPQLIASLHDAMKR